MTQAEVAKACGIEPASYSDIENGKKGTKPATAKKLGTCLDFPWYQLYDSDDLIETEDPK